MIIFKLEILLSFHGNHLRHGIPTTKNIINRNLIWIPFSRSENVDSSSMLIPVLQHVMDLKEKKSNSDNIFQLSKDINLLLISKVKLRWWVGFGKINQIILHHVQIILQNLPSTFHIHGSSSQQSDPEEIFKL